MFDLLLKILLKAGTILGDVSIYLLLGFFIAGLIHVYLPQDKIKKLFGKRNLRSVLNASLFGIPLPLCSCSVLPTAVELRKSGASKGAIFSFLISTPETSVPSIGISFALLDPLMTVFRPIAALITALLAGMGINLVDKDNGSDSDLTDLSRADLAGNACKNNSVSTNPGADAGHGTKIWSALKYSFTVLLDDLAPWLVLGLLAAGLISVLVPDTLFTGFLGRGVWPMLLMLVIGIPLYVCAESSTPIAAALILKGLSPGAALVFLLVGPATNASSLVVLSNYFSRKILGVYLAAIAIMALLLGALLNWLYPFLGLNLTATLGNASAIFPGWVKVSATLILAGLLHRSLASQHKYRSAWEWIRSKTGWTGKKLARLLIALAAIFYLLDGFFIVPAGSTGMVQSFGRIIQSDLPPGLHYRPPTPFGQTVLVKTDLVRCVEFGFRRMDNAVAPGLVSSTPEGSVYMEKLDILPQQDAPEESELLAGDENLIEIDLTVQYSIADPFQATYRVENIEQVLRELTMHHILQEIAIREVSDELTSERAHFETGVETGLRQSLQQLGLGVKLHGVYVVYSHAPGVVHPAYRDVASAMEDKYQYVNLAETDSVAILAEARRLKTERLTGARIDSAKSVSAATGQADRFLNISRATRSYRSTQQFRLNTEAAVSTLTGLDKICLLTDQPGVLDLIVFPTDSSQFKIFPPTSARRQSSP